jgi:hypothetical protein
LPSRKKNDHGIARGDNMTLVRIIKDWDWPALNRQTPGRKGFWQDFQFSEQPVLECDYAVILNYVPKPVSVLCPPEHIWTIMQEPPNSEYQKMHQGKAGEARVFTQDTSLVGARYIYSHGALPWHVERDYDFLKKCPPPDKPRTLSWVTSSLKVFQGHRDRMDFLDKISNQIEFDLWGRGFTPINDKWDGLAPYRYSLAVENYRGPYYWTEKIADCFLSWTMPIYYGCTNLEDYFPKDSNIRIDIHDPDAVDRVREGISSDQWLRQRDAIAEARNLVLDKHQLFPWLVDKISQNEKCDFKNRQNTYDVINLHTPRLPQTSLIYQLKKFLKAFIIRNNKIRRTID